MIRFTQDGMDVNDADVPEVVAIAVPDVITLEFIADIDSPVTIGLVNVLFVSV